VRQQVYASLIGDFSMQLGSMTDSYLDASGERTSQYDEAHNKNAINGISRRELAYCELRASTSGFRSDVINLVDLNNFGSTVDVGVIVVHRGAKVEGMTLSAMPYKAPEGARRAYEKGLKDEKNGKLSNARDHFEKAVEMYPKYVSAWFQLGTVLQKEKQENAARAAFTQATTIDTKFLPPYLSLASMAFETENWNEVLNFTDHILDLDPLNRTNITGYFVDLDPVNSAEAYFYNAMANYKLNKIEEAEKSGLKAEHVDLRTRYPQLHLLLAEIFARKNNYGSAISEIQMYLELAPHAEDAEQLR
jgi:tetratricopeptide (TPR) repeat protein